MNRLFTLLFLSACAANGDAVRPAPPPPATLPSVPIAADPAPATEGDVTEIWFQGMRILVKRVPGAELAALHLYVQGGVRNWSQADAGVESLGFAVAVSGGTERLDKDAFTRRLTELGSTLNSVSNEEYSALAAKTLRAAFDPTFELLVDVFRHPALPRSEIELKRQLQLAGLKHELDDPDSKLALIRHAAIFRGHPYANRPVGSLASVAALTPETIKSHLATLRERSRLLLVVVGDVDPNHVLDLVRTGFGDLPRGSYAATAVPPWTVDKAAVQVTEQKLPTNYIEADFPIPPRTDPLYPAGVLALRILGERVFEEVRSNRNLSYAPGAWLATTGTLVRGTLYVTAVDPNTTMKVMFDEARRLQTEPVPEDELLSNKSMYLTANFMFAETSDGQADMLANALLIGGDWRRVRTLPEQVRAVSAADIQEFAKRHIAKLQSFVLGDSTKIDSSVFNAL